MASLESRGCCYRLVFRWDGRKYQHPLRTADRREAESCRERLEEGMRLLARGRLDPPPPGADLGLYLLSDGKLAGRAPGPARRVTLGELFDVYRATLTDGAKAASTLSTERTHIGHLRAGLAPTSPVESLTKAQLRPMQSAAPPTRTRNKDGSISVPRRYVDADAGFAPMPDALVDYLVANLRRRPAARERIVPDREGLGGLAPIDRLKAQLRKMRLDWSPCGRGLASRCPAHLGSRTNLTFAEAEDGRLLLYCQRGCDLDAILAAVCLHPYELFYDPGGPARPHLRRSRVPPTAPRAADVEARLHASALDRGHRGRAGQAGRARGAPRSHDRRPPPARCRLA